MLRLSQTWLLEVPDQDFIATQETEVELTLVQSRWRKMDLFDDVRTKRIIPK
jgi:hypothetical protein